MLYLIFKIVKIGLIVGIIYFTYRILDKKLNISKPAITVLSSTKKGVTEGYGFLLKTAKDQTIDSNKGDNGY